MPEVPEGFCNSLGTDWVQQLVNLVAQGVAVLDSGSSTGTIILNQENQPDPAQQIFLWRKPSRGNLIFQYIGGAWVCPNPEPASGPIRRIFEGDPSDVDTYDGGTAGAVGTNAGPMWEIDHNYDGRSPMGPGAIPDTTDTLVVATNYGHGQSVIAQSNLPATINLKATFDGHRTNLEDGTPQWLCPTGSGGDVPTTPVTEDATIAFTNTGGGVALNLVQPVRGAYMIRRTARVNYVAG